MTQDLTTFVPDQDNTRLLRDAFGRFATGVTIVTTMTEDGPIGITANSFSSVSLDPALVLWAPDKKSRRSEHFMTAETYVVHILSAEQAGLCWDVAKDAKALEAIPFETSEKGHPILSDSLAWFECTKAQTVDAGDHTVIIGTVDKACLRESGEALAFFKGKMGGFVPQD